MAALPGDTATRTFPQVASLAWTDGQNENCWSPYDGDWAYWATRLGNSPDLSPSKAALLKRQQGCCGHCHLRLITGNLLEVHHVDGNHKNNRQGNLQLLHRHCHQELTRTMLHDKATHVEEPCAVKAASTVLKPSGGSDIFA